MIIDTFCSANTNKDNANVALASSNSQLENFGFKILPSDTQRTTSELADASAKFEAWRIQMFHNFQYLQSDMVFGIINFFSCCIECKAVGFFPLAES